jgi:hypothetical protein
MKGWYVMPTKHLESDVITIKGWYVMPTKHLESDVITMKGWYVMPCTVTHVLRHHLWDKENVTL